MPRNSWFSEGWAVVTETFALPSLFLCTLCVWIKIKSRDEISCKCVVGLSTKLDTNKTADSEKIWAQRAALKGDQYKNRRTHKPNVIANFAGAVVTVHIWNMHNFRQTMHTFFLNQYEMIEYVASSLKRFGKNVNYEKKTICFALGLTPGFISPLI